MIAQSWFFTWHLYVLLLFLLSFFITGTILLRRGVAKRAGRRVSKTGKAFVALLVASVVGGIGALVTYMLVDSIGARMDMELLIPGLIVGAVCALFLGLLVLYAMYSLPFGTIVRAALPTLLLALGLGVALGVPTGLITRHQRLRAARQAISENAFLKYYLPRIREFEDKFGRYPRDLQELAEKTPDSIPPARPEVIYHPPAGTADAGDAPIIACDSAEAQLGEGRVCLHADGKVRWYDAQAFRDLLKREQNRQFAEALEAAESGGTGGS